MIVLNLINYTCEIAVHRAVILHEYLFIKFESELRGKNIILPKEEQCYFRRGAKLLEATLLSSRGNGATIENRGAGYHSIKKM